MQFFINLLTLIFWVLRIHHVVGQLYLLALSVCTLSETSKEKKNFMKTLGLPS